MTPDHDSRADATLELAPDEMRRLGHAVVESLVGHFARLREKPVVNVASREETERLLREPAPESGCDLETVLQEFEDKVAPWMSHVDHPRTFAFVPGAGTFVGAMGDALASGYNIYAGTWVESSAAHQLELVVTDWFRDWLGMPESAGGTLVSGGSVANLTGLALARELALEGDPRDGVIYVGALSHSSVRRGARILGFRPDQVRQVPTDDRFRTDVDALRSAVDRDAAAGRRPFCVVASAGTTSTGTVDPLAETAGLCRERDLWFHVDAAYGGFAVLDPRGKRLLQGIERADSLALDPHKWFYTPFEAGCLLARDVSDLHEVFHILPDYLVDVSGGHDRPNMCDRGIQLSRATRALKIWMTVKAFGLARIRAAIGRSLDLARDLQAQLESTPGFEVTSPAELGVVTFRYVGNQGPRDESTLEAMNQEILRRVWGSGRAMISSTRLDGRYVLRMCVINHNTLKSDVDEVVELMTAIAEAVTSEPGEDVR